MVIVSCGAGHDDAIETDMASYEANVADFID